MPLVPNEYAVLTNLRDALAAIRVGDGYYYDVLGTAVKLDPNHDTDVLWAEGAPRPFVLIELNSDAWSYEPEFPKGRGVLELRATIHWVNESDPTRDADRIQTYLQGVADVEKAITADLQRGGLVMDTRIVSRAFDTAVDGSMVWGTVDVVMKLKRLYGSPDVTV